ncbi:MAG: AsmA family protein, partial [Janthinobacterium lividum]
MRQWSKAARWSAACAGVVVCLLLSALGAVHFYFTPARVTALLQTRLQALSKRDVGLASARIAWLPSPGLAMQDMTLGNPAWAREKNLLHVSSLKLQLALLPLLSGRVAINAVALDGVTVNLERNQAGQTSWQDLMAQPTGQQKTPGEGSETQGSARKSSFEPLTLTDLTLSNARLSYRNTGSIGSTGSTGTRGAAIDGSAGHAERNNAVDSVDAWQIETLRARSQTGGRALDTSATVLHNGHRLDAHVQLADFSAIGEPGASTTGTVRLAWEKGTLTLDGVLPLAVPAALQGAATQAGSAVSSTPTASRPAASAPAALPAAPGKAAGTDPAAAAPMAADGTGIALPTRENRHSSSAAAPSFKLALDAASMRPLLGFVDIDTTPVAPVKLAAQLSMQGDWLHAANIQASLGQQTLSGDLLYSRSGTRPQFKASIHGQRIVWAQLTADAGRAAPPPVPPGEVFYVHDLAWNALVAMKPMDGTLALHLDAFRTRSNIDVSDVNASMRFAGDQLDIGSFTLKAFGGTAAGRMQLDGTRQTARLGIKTDAISLGQWVTQKTGKNLFTGAPLALTAQITASGSSMKKLAASLTGPVTVRI